MALIHRALPLPVHAPTPPDHVLCHRQTSAQPILPNDCQLAIERDWPDGNTYQRFYITDPTPSDADILPIYSYLGSCRVGLETAGPAAHLPHSMLLRPSELRGLAGYLIQKCAVEADGIGGFATLGFESAMSWVHDATNTTFGGNFITISIEPRVHMGRVHIIEPGSLDANIPAKLSAHVAGLASAVGEHGGKMYYDMIAKNLHNRALEMEGNYNPNLTWWSKDDRFSWWAHRFSRRENSSSTETLDRSSFTNSSDDYLGVVRPNVSSALEDSAGSGEPEEVGGSRSGNFTMPPDLGDSDDSGDRGDDERSLQPGTTHATASEGEGPEDGTPEEGSGDGNEEATQGMHDLGLDAGDMTYQCDDSLGGGPDPVDCEKLSWSGLKPPHSLETLYPNVPQFYTQGTCGFAISSVTPTTILWSHLLTAFQTLNMFCVQNPISKVKGGRAYYGQQHVSSWINGRIRRKRDSQSTEVDAREALPKGINATIFRHDSKSNTKCEWLLAEERKNLTMCGID